jgi:cytochrome bd-type quinol oxidase subunit 2
LQINSKQIGVFTAISMIAIAIVNYYILKQPENGKVNYFSYSILCIAIVAALFLFHKKTASSSIKNYFNEGFKVFVIVALFMAIYTFVFYKFNPALIASKVAEVNAINATDKNKTPAEVIANGEKLRQVFIPMTIGVSTIVHLIIGALVSLVAGAFFSQTNNKS